MALPSLPKLAAWKTNDNAKSISVLGQNEIQLTNISIVAERYRLLANTRTDRPDETYLVASCLSPNWWVRPAPIDDRSYFEGNHFVMGASWERATTLRHFTLRNVTIAGVATFVVYAE
jgi:hypothetical protein